MTIHTYSVGRIAAMNAMYDVLNGGTLELRSGAQEANPEAAAGGVALATLTFGSPAFGAAVGGAGATVVKTANAIASAVAAATGVAAHFRLVTSGAACVVIGDVAASASDINIPINIGAGATVSISSLAIQMVY
jgi:hypothetical protein